jgi:hypothetical protein
MPHGTDDRLLRLASSTARGRDPQAKLEWVRIDRFRPGLRREKSGMADQFATSTTVLWLAELFLF